MKMEKRKLGSQGPKVSTIGLGCIDSGHGYGSNWDARDYVSDLRAAVDVGVNFFDTELVYGAFQHDELVGRTFAPIRDQVVIASGFGWFTDNLRTSGLDSRPETIRLAADEALRFLELETIDLFYQDRATRHVPIEDVAGTVKDLIQQGKVRAFGLGAAMDAQTLRRAHAIQPVSAVVSEYSLWWREPEVTLFPTLEELGIAFVPRYPMGSATFWGTLDEETTFNRHDPYRRDLPRYTPEEQVANRALVKLLKGIAKRRGATPAQVAIAWVRARKPWIVPLAGNTQPQRWVENVGAAFLPLTADEVLELDQASARVTVPGSRDPGPDR